MRLSHFVSSLLGYALLASTSAAAGENWPDYRGPSEDGHTSEGTTLPTEWSETENVTWKTEIKGKAWSSPVIWGDQIWMTNADEAGTRLSVVCVDKNTGKVIHDKVVQKVAEPQFCHAFNSHASPSPVLEEGRVYITFGAPWTGCLDAESGEVLWERADFECNHFRGPGSSPLVVGDLLYLNYDGSDFQYIVAMNKKTGETVWKTDRSVDFKDVDEKTGKIAADGDWRKAYSTPRIMEVDGKSTLLSLGSMAFYAYDPKTGEEVWKTPFQPNHSGALRPLIGNGLIFIPTGSGGEVYAIKPGGEVAWRFKRVNPRRASPILLGDLLFMVDDGGVAACLDAKTGEEVWMDRIGGNFSASMIYADGKIWCFDEDGKSTVIEAGREFKIVAQNELDAGCMGSPAVSGNALFVRTRTHLYRIEE
ncbi:MAG: outer membrane protein assembly factor BamB [Verrucomicrobiales bacterium]|jgi:outer membrane protein assembly factor BamB